MTGSPFTFAALAAAAGTPLAADHPDRLAAATERAALLKEALYGLLHLRAQEQAGVGLPDAAAWDRAFAHAAEVYGEESPR